MKTTKAVSRWDFNLDLIILRHLEDLEDEEIELIQGLSQTPKTLPCRYFYDDQGSTLFEQICDLPEYYPNRTEQAILAARALKVAQITGSCELVELGSGSSRKTRLLLDAYSQLSYPLCYCPIDVSAGILKTSALKLVEQYPQLQIRGFVGTYEQALSQLPTSKLNSRLLIFLGSTLGNLDVAACDRFLTQVKQVLCHGDYFLIGVDLQKEQKILEAAYNDAQGITAAFNLNMLRHLNMRFDGDFDLEQFAHKAFYNPLAHQIEMHLCSLRTQTVVLQALKFKVSLAAGETIRTEISRKFHLPTLISVIESQGLQPVQIWTDPHNWFALLLCQMNKRQ